jgi:hypothetical protein
MKRIGESRGLGRREQTEPVLEDVYSGYVVKGR